MRESEWRVPHRGPRGWNSAIESDTDDDNIYAAMTTAAMPHKVVAVRYIDRVHLEWSHDGRTWVGE